MACRYCGLAVDDCVELGALGQLDLEDQVFITSFLRGQGSSSEWSRCSGSAVQLLRTASAGSSSNWMLQILPPTADNTEVPDRKELMASPPRHRRVRDHAEPDLSVERDKGEQIRVYCE